MDTATLNLSWARALVEAMVGAGLDQACISPGSRSTPLTLALAEHPALSRTVHIDERSAAFFALGHARATGRPALLVCTSGTAGANYLPAVIEASQDRVPLIALTADRPPELRDTGAWQTIDQIKLFGDFTRWFCELSPPFEGDFALRYVRDLGRRAVSVASGPIPGPVHLNAPFREPLAPSPIPALEPAPGPEPDPSGGRPAGAPPTVSPARARDPRPEELRWLAEAIAAAPRGLILAGRLGPLELGRPPDAEAPDAPPDHRGIAPTGAHAPTDEAAAEPAEDAPLGAYARALAQLAAVTGYPILAEPAGGLRYGAHDHRAVLCGYEAILRDPAWCAEHPPHLVLRFGASFAWKQVAGYLGQHEETLQVRVDPLQRWDEPGRRGGPRLPVDPTGLAEGLSERLEPMLAPRSGADGAARRQRAEAAASWRASWTRASAAARAMAEALAASPESAGSVAWVYPALLEALPAGALLFAANSMAVRDLDSFGGRVDRPIRVLANRGAAGIDGTLSSALGAALGSGRPSVLVTGDLAFLHDLNGLATIGAETARLQVVVLNDEGGGIFEHLPVAAGDRARFERYFRTPPGADLAAACAAYGRPHRLAREAGELRAALEAGWVAGGLAVIEVPVDMARNTALHRRLWREVGEALH